jgi:DNA polymerase III epsilon subunit family exonuclease
MAIALHGSFDALSTPLHQVTFVVVDVETTGGSPTGASLTEVAAARYRGGELVGTYQTLVRPDERIPPFITALTGISDAMVADAPRIGAMLPSFLEFVGGSVLVGHNLRFDLSFLDHALRSTGREPLANRTVDTLALARRLVRDVVDNCKLGTLAATLGLPHQPSHRAMTDVLATGDLLHALLERAGSFGIVDLGELLLLPALIGHPQAAKLRLTVRLPHRPGVYWFTDAAGHVLAVGRADDLQARVRSYFTPDQPRSVGRLLRQLHAVHHRVCPGPLTAAIVEGRLIRDWSPPFNRQDVVRVRPTGSTAGTAGTAGVAGVAGTARSRPRRGRRRTWTAEQLSCDPVELLAPLADQIRGLALQQRYEEAGALRDEADALRGRLELHRAVSSLREAGRMVLAVEGEGELVLDRGIWAGGATGLGLGLGLGLDGTVPEAEDQLDLERAIVARWLTDHAGSVRIIEVESPTGLSIPAARIPELADLCAQDPVAATVGSAA